MSDAAPIPKEKLTAFQRWELASFDAAAPAPAEIADPATVTPAVSELELAAQRESARAEGYGEGYAQGLEEGRAAIEAERRELAALLAGLRTELAAVPYTLADDALDLALDLAQTLVRGKFEIDREPVIALTRDALTALPRVSQPATLALNPEDVATVRDALGDELAGWQVRADPALARGGCRVETAESRIDASLEARWERLSTALGQPRSWLKAGTAEKPRRRGEDTPNP
jgi:flagellar assembly protein FliH